MSDLERHFVCQVCGKRGADVRPDFDWEQAARQAMTRAQRDRWGSQ